METISNFNFRSFQLHANFTLDHERITRRNYVTYYQNWRLAMLNFYNSEEFRFDQIEFDYSENKYCSHY